MLVGLVTLLLQSALGAGPTCPTLKENELSSTKVYQLTQNSACKIRSVSDLITHLPESFRSQYALFYRSRSIQGPNRTDYKRPRAILVGQPYGKKNVFMLSFNSGDPDQPGANSVEMVDIDTGGGRNNVEVFKYRDLTFKDGKATLSHANPAKCKTCHGEPARPIYPGYPDWEGSYGALHVDRSTPEEIAGFEAFEAANAINENSRYRLLSSGPNSDPGDPHYAFRRANDVINAELGSANAIRVARLMMKTPGFAKFKYAIAAGLLSCGGLEAFVPSALAERLHGKIDERFGLTQALPREKLDEIYRGIHANNRNFILSDFMGADKDDKVPYPQFEKNFRAAFASSPSMERLYLDTFRVQGFTRADPMGANLRFLMEGRGLKIDNYFLDLMQPTYRYHNGADASFNTVEEIAKHDRDIAELIKPNIKLSGFPPRPPKTLQPDQKLCDRLKKKSLAALKTFKLPGGDANTEAGAGCVDCARTSGGPLQTQAREKIRIAEEARRSGYPHTFSQSCASCHDGAIDFAPRIPFSDPDKFRQWLATGENAAMVRERLLHPNEEMRMPQNERLSDEEVNRLIRYISVER